MRDAYRDELAAALARADAAEKRAIELEAQAKRCVNGCADAPTAAAQPPPPFQRLLIYGRFSQTARFIGTYPYSWWGRLRIWLRIQLHTLGDYWADVYIEDHRDGLCGCSNADCDLPRRPSDSPLKQDDPWKDFTFPPNT